MRRRAGLAVETIAEGLHETTEEVQRWLDEENARCRNRPDPFRKSCADCGRPIDGITIREMDSYYHENAGKRKLKAGSTQTLNFPS
jgi:hypothetical protein